MKTGIYQHYKGHKYKVLGVVIHSEELGEYVLYEKLESSDKFPIGTQFVRPKGMFEEHVELNGRKVKRFTYLEEE